MVWIRLTNVIATLDLRYSYVIPNLTATLYYLLFPKTVHPISSTRPYFLLIKLIMFSFFLIHPRKLNTTIIVNTNNFLSYKYCNTFIPDFQQLLQIQNNLIYSKRPFIVARCSQLAHSFLNSINFGCRIGEQVSIRD